MVNETYNAEYKINSVTDKDMTEPDRNEYILRETGNGIMQ